jgi:hypothetical protein
MFSFICERNLNANINIIIYTYRYIHIYLYMYMYTNINTYTYIYMQNMLPKVGLLEETKVGEKEQNDSR